MKKYLYFISKKIKIIQNKLFIYFSFFSFFLIFILIIIYFFSHNSNPQKINWQFLNYQKKIFLKAALNNKINNIDFKNYIEYLKNKNQDLKDLYEYDYNNDEKIQFKTFNFKNVNDNLNSLKKIKGLLNSQNILEKFFNFKTTINDIYDRQQVFFMDSLVNNNFTNSIEKNYDWIIMIFKLLLKNDDIKINFFKSDKNEILELIKSELKPNNLNEVINLIQKFLFTIIKDFIMFFNKEKNKKIININFLIKYIKKIKKFNFFNIKKLPDLFIIQKAIIKIINDNKKNFSSLFEYIKTKISIKDDWYDFHNKINDQNKILYFQNIFFLNWRNDSLFNDLLQKKNNISIKEKNILQYLKNKFKYIVNNYKIGSDFFTSIMHKNFIIELLDNNELLFIYFFIKIINYIIEVIDRKWKINETIYNNFFNFYKKFDINNLTLSKIFKIINKKNNKKIFVASLNIVLYEIKFPELLTKFNKFNKLIKKIKNILFQTNLKKKTFKNLNNFINELKKIFLLKRKQKINKLKNIKTLKKYIKYIKFFCNLFKKKQILYINKNQNDYYNLTQFFNKIYHNKSIFSLSPLRNQYLIDDGSIKSQSNNFKKMIFDLNWFFNPFNFENLYENFKKSKDYNDLKINLNFIKAIKENLEKEKNYLSNLSNLTELQNNRLIHIILKLKKINHKDKYNFDNIIETNNQTKIKEIIRILIQNFDYLENNFLYIKNEKFFINKNATLINKKIIEINQKIEDLKKKPEFYKNNEKEFLTEKKKLFEKYKAEIEKTTNNDNEKIKYIFYFLNYSINKKNNKLFNLKNYKKFFKIFLNKDYKSFYKTKKIATLFKDLSLNNKYEDELFKLKYKIWNEFDKGRKDINAWSQNWFWNYFYEKEKLSIFDLLTNNLSIFKILNQLKNNLFKILINNYFKVIDSEKIYNKIKLKLLNLNKKAQFKIKNKKITKLEIENLIKLLKKLFNNFYTSVILKIDIHKIFKNIKFDYLKEKTINNLLFLFKDFFLKNKIEIEIIIIIIKKILNNKIEYFEELKKQHIGEITKLKYTKISLYKYKFDIQFKTNSILKEFNIWIEIETNKREEKNKIKFKIYKILEKIK